MTMKPGFITTYSGQRIKSSAVYPTQIDREDCTRGLAMLPRFLGQTRLPYSVAEHSILVSTIAEFHGAKKTELQCSLLHDGHEYLTGDWPTPFKDEIVGLRQWENRIKVVFRASLSLPAESDPVWVRVKHWDLVALHYEAHNLMEEDPGWLDESLLAKVSWQWAPIRCLPWHAAVIAFGERASELGLHGF